MTTTTTTLFSPLSRCSEYGWKLVLSASVALLTAQPTLVVADSKQQQQQQQQHHVSAATMSLNASKSFVSPFSFNSSSSTTSFRHNSSHNSSSDADSDAGAAGAGGQIVHNLNIWICTLLAVFGCVSNFISFVIFMRAGRFPPKITTRNSLIVLTVSNSIFLLLYWYDNVFPPLIDLFENQEVHAFLRKLYLNNSNAFFCKFIPYSINVTMCLNASITVSFSLERAFAIYFPLKLINLKQTCPYLNRTVIIFNIALSLVLPAYYLFVLEITRTDDKNMCDASEQHKPLYFTLTVVFFIVIFGLPFIIITISNIAIVVRLYQNKMILAHKHLTRAAAASRLNSEREETTNIVDLNNDVPMLRKHGGSGYVGINNSNNNPTCLTKKLIEYANHNDKNGNGAIVGGKKKQRYDMVLKLKGGSSSSQKPAAQLYEMTNLNRIDRLRHDSLPMSTYSSDNQIAASAQHQQQQQQQHPNQHNQHKRLTSPDALRLSAQSTASLSPRARASISVANYAYLNSPVGLGSANGNGKSALSSKSIRKSRSYLNQNFRITKMLLTISASFVLLNFPYFLAWCIYADFRLNNDIHYDEELYNQAALRFKFVKLAEMLNLFNYSITGLLYFASGKIYRAHLYCIFGCTKRNRIKFRF